MSLLSQRQCIRMCDQRFRWLDIRWRAWEIPSRMSRVRFVDHFLNISASPRVADERSAEPMMITNSAPAAMLLCGLPGNIEFLSLSLGQRKNRDEVRDTFA